MGWCIVRLIMSRDGTMGRGGQEWMVSMGDDTSGQWMSDVHDDTSLKSS